MKKFMDSPLLRRARGDPSCLDCICSEELVRSELFVSTDRCGSRRTVGIDGVRVNLAIPTSASPRGLDACCSVFKDHAQPRPWPADLLRSPPSRPPPRRKALTRAHRAPRYVSDSVFGRSRRCVKRIRGRPGG
jgi:hypothetical protein